MDTKTEQHIIEKKTDDHGNTEKHETHDVHTDKGDEHSEFHATAQAIEQKFKFKEIIIFLLILGVGMLAAWGINKAIQNNKDDTNTVATAPGDVELPNYGTPPSTNQNTNTSSNANSNTGSTPATTTTDTGTSTPVAVDTTPVAFNSTTLGFTFTLPGGWAQAVPESSASEIVFFDRLHQSVISTVEVYSNTDNATVDSLLTQLSSSPTAHNVRKTVINGVEWIEFDSTSGSFNHGLATVHNGRVYYINGELSKPEFAQQFRLN